MDNEKTGTGVAETLPGIPPAVIVDLGGRSKKSIKKLKDGQGKLMVEVERAVEQVRSSLPDHDKNKQIIPVLVIYRKKAKKVKAAFPLPPLSPLSLFR